MNLPDGFEWYNFDIHNDINQIYSLLDKHYVNDGNYSLNYSREFLIWALTPPNYKRNWHVSVRYKKKIVAMITAIPINSDTVEINFLCIHKKLRGHRLTPVLIQELKSRITYPNAIYTSATLLYNPISKRRYWHKNLTQENFTSKYDIRPMNKKDNLYKALNKDEHWFLPNEVVHTYIVNENNLFSYYTLNSKNCNSVIKSAYGFYTICNTVSMIDLINEALCVTKSQGYDYFNCLDILDYSQILEPLKFELGTGYLYFYSTNGENVEFIPL